MLLFCRACLAMDVKLVELKEYYLDTVYRNVVQQSIAGTNGVPEVMCVECAFRLLNCQKFREKCLKSNLILRDLMRSCNKLSREHIKSVDRRTLNLISNLNISQPELKKDIIHIKYDDSDFNRENNKIENPEWMVTVKSETAIDTYETRNKSLEGFNEQKFNINVENTIDIDSEKFDISDNDDRLDGDNVSDDDKNDIGDFFDDNDGFIAEGYCDEAVKESDSSSDSDDNLPLKTAKLKSLHKLKNKKTESSTEKGTLKRKDVRKRKTKTIETEKIDRRRKPLVPDDRLSTLLTARKLSFEEQVQEILKRKDSANYKNSTHKCDICFKGFSAKSAIEIHMLRHGDQYGKHECNICHLRFRSANSAKKHTTASHVEMYSCTECPYNTTYRQSAKLHVNWHKGKKYKCQHCEEEFVRFTTYMGHLRIKHASDYICELCGFAFISPKGIDLHKRLKHPKAQAVPDDGPFCQECNVRFLSTAAYDQHIKVSSRHRYTGLARLRSVSTERSRSVTPALPGPQSSLRPSAARRALLMGLSLNAPEVDPEVGDPPSKNSNILERVEAMDLSEDEAEDVLEGAPWHVQRWVKDLPPSSATAILAEATGTENLPSTSGATVTSGTKRKVVCEDSDLDSDFDDEFDVSPIESTNFTGRVREIPSNDELEEPVREIVNAVQRAMDEEIDRVVGPPMSFEWVEGFESFRGRPENFSDPTPGPLKDYDTPYDAFCDIWSEDIMKSITVETKRYAQQTIPAKKEAGVLGESSRLHQWNPTDVDELLVLFGVFMYMGIDSRTSQYEYWKANDYLELSKFRQIMGYNRFILLNKFLHFVDNSNIGQDCLQNEGISKRLRKLSPIITFLNKKISSL